MAAVYDYPSGMDGQDVCLRGQCVKPRLTVAERGLQHLGGVCLSFARAFTHKINTSVVTVLRRSIVEAAGGGGVERVQTADSSPLLTTSVNHSVSRELTTDRVSLS